jgi:hypothetical protein
VDLNRERDRLVDGRSPACQKPNLQRRRRRCLDVERCHGHLAEVLLVLSERDDIADLADLLCLSAGDWSRCRQRRSTECGDECHEDKSAGSSER